MKRAYKFVMIGFGLTLVGHFLQVAGLHMTDHTPRHATKQGQALLQSRVGRTYWVKPAANSTYQFVRFGDENATDSIGHGVAVKGTETFTVIRLAAKPDSDDGAYQVRFANGALKWMDSSAFNIHQYGPENGVKRPFEIFDEDPSFFGARTPDKRNADTSPSLGPNPDEPAHVFFGMTEQQALASEWGKPGTVLSFQASRGKVDGWLYGNGNFLTFTNGRLEEVRNSL